MDRTHFIPKLSLSLGHALWVQRAGLALAQPQLQLLLLEPELTLGAKA